MKIWIVMWSDRHTDMGVFPFTTEEAAVEWAKARASEELKASAPLQYPGDSILDDAKMMATWTPFYCTYSDEGDCICVISRTLDLGTGE
jgi:hypothetical protein